MLYLSFGHIMILFTVLKFVISYNFDDHNDYRPNDLHDDMYENSHSNIFLHNDDDNHVGHSNIKAMVLTEDVLHKNDGNLYTSNNVLSDAFVKGRAKNVDQQINEMRVDALKSQRESMAAKQAAADYLHRMKELQAEEKLAKVQMLEKQKHDIDHMLHSPKHELTKDIMPIVAVTPHSLGFLAHDKLELERLNDIREAALREADMQKHNALLQGKVSPHSVMDLISSNPSLFSDFYSKAPVKKSSVVVDPTKGRFSVFSGETVQRDPDNYHAEGDNLSNSYISKYNDPHYSLSIPNFLNRYVDENINKISHSPEQHETKHKGESLSTWI